MWANVKKKVNIIFLNAGYSRISFLIAFWVNVIFWTKPHIFLERLGNDDGYLTNAVAYFLFAGFGADSIRPYGQLAVAYSLFAGFGADSIRPDGQLAVAYLFVYIGYKK